MIVLVTVPVVLVMTLLVTVLENYQQGDGLWEFHHESYYLVVGVTVARRKASQSEAWICDGA